MFDRDYNKLYSSKDKKDIFNQLKALEKNKFLQLEMMNKEVDLLIMKNFLIV